MANQKSSSTGRISKQKEFEIKRRKKKKIRLIMFLIIVVLIIICVYLLQSEKYRIKDIEIVGNKQLTQEQIYEMCGIKLGDNIFTRFNIVTEVKLKENRYIKDVKITKQYPNEIKIEITERVKDFQIKTENGNYIYIDEQGYLLELLQESQGLITIEGMEITKELFEGKLRLEDDDLDRMENILQIREKTRMIEIFDKITQIHVKDEYIITLGNERININLGNATQLGDRIDYVKSILKDINGQAGTIYVNGNLNEGFKPYFTAE